MTRLRLVLSSLLAGALCSVAWVLWMPGQSHKGPLPPATQEELETEARLRSSVKSLAEDIGPRNLQAYPSLEKAASWIQDQFQTAGLLVHREVFCAGGLEVRNVWAERTGTTRPNEITVVGAHYDNYGPHRGADDNASGVAALVELAGLAARRSPASSTVRFVAFVNEEPPFFMTDQMGSLVHARGCVARHEKIAGMWTLEMIGYYRDEPGSQRYPWPLGWYFPSEGNFIGFVGRHSSRGWIQRCIKSFRGHTAFPSEGIASPISVPGLELSDHWAFANQGFPALMIVDGGPFRNPNYHRSSDTPDTLDYARMSRVTRGLDRVLQEVLK